jgi:hypothetical protein
MRAGGPTAEDLDRQLEIEVSEMMAATVIGAGHTGRIMEILGASSAQNVANIIGSVLDEETTSVVTKPI